jgi:hypothetical protein
MTAEAERSRLRRRRTDQATRQTVPLLLLCLLLVSCSREAPVSLPSPASQRLGVEPLGAAAYTLLGSEIDASNGPPTRTFQFHVGNGGPGDASVRLMHKSCACVEAHLLADPATHRADPPLCQNSQQTWELNMRIKPAIGRQAARATLSANYPDGHSEVHDLIGRITKLEDITLSPGVLRLAVEDPTSTPTHHIVTVTHRYRSRDAGHVSLSVASEVPWIKAIEMVKTGGPERLGDNIVADHWRLGLTCRAGDVVPSGKYAISGRVVIKSARTDGHNAMASQGLFVVVQRFKGIVACPTLSFGTIALNKQYERTIWMRAADGRPFRVLRAFALDPCLKINSPARESANVDLTVRLQPSRIGPIRTQIDIVTNHPASPFVAVAVEADSAQALATADRER